MKMKENKTSEKIKHFAKKKWDSFTDWFTDREHPHSRLNKNVFFHDSLKLIGLILVFLIIYSNVDKINQIVLIFIKLGSLLQLVLLFFILRKAGHLTINLKYAFRGLNHGTKAIIAIVIVLLLFMAFLNQDKVVGSITQTYQEANFSKLNPVQISGNFSLGNLSKSDMPKISSSSFRCEEELSEWLKTEKIKLSSSVSVKVVEKKSFTNKTELLDYVDGWNSFNEYEVEKKIGEITKMPEPQGDYDLRREDKKFILDFDYQEGDINSMRIVVTKGYFSKETICDETVEGSSGTIECDVSDAGEGEFKAEAYIDTVDKIWTGQIDTVLIKEEGQINYNDVAILVIGICEEEGKLSFK
jgi:hypothetical protein